MRTNKLWKVEARNNTGRGYKLLKGDLWILAKSAEQATTKANRWLKRNSYFSYKVTIVEFEGIIDVF